MRVIRIECEDMYEAEKLAAIMSVQRDGSVFVESVMSIIGKEVVLRLRDKSSHSVMLKDHQSLQSLKEALAQVALGRSRIVRSGFTDYTAEIILSDDVN